MKFPINTSSVGAGILACALLFITPSCKTGPRAADASEKNAATIATELAIEAATKIVQQFQAKGGSIQGQKLALVIREQPIRMAMPVTTRRGPSGPTIDLKDLWDGAVGHTEYEQNEVELTADIKSAVEEGVIEALMPTGSYVFASASVDTILDSLGIKDAQLLLDPATFDRFKERVRAEAGQSTLDGLLIAVHSADQVKKTRSLDFKVRVHYVDMRPTPTAPIQGVSALARADAEGIFRPIHDGQVSTPTPEPDRGQPEEASTPRSSGGDPEGDTMGTAREVRIGATCSTDIGRRGDANDYFRFSSPADGFVTVEVRNSNPQKAGGAIGWEIVDSGDKHLARGGAHAGQAHSDMISVSAGSTYFVKVQADARVDKRIEYALSTVYSRN